MWEQVASRLGTLLEQNIYPLLASRPVPLPHSRYPNYRELLERAGVITSSAEGFADRGLIPVRMPRLPGDSTDLYGGMPTHGKVSSIIVVPGRSRATWRSLTNSTARQIVGKLSADRSLVEDSRKVALQATEIMGPVRLLRVGTRSVDSRGEIGYNETGSWWFDESTIIAARKATQHPDELYFVLQELRRLLAIQFDWSNCTDIWQLKIPANTALPAIVGEGAPRPLAEPGFSAATDRVGAAARLEGGTKQIFFPWIPNGLVSDFAMHR